MNFLLCRPKPRTETRVYCFRPSAISGNLDLTQQPAGQRNASAVQITTADIMLVAQDLAIKTNAVGSSRKEHHGRHGFVFTFVVVYCSVGKYNHLAVVPYTLCRQLLQVCKKCFVKSLLKHRKQSAIRGLKPRRERIVIICGVDEFHPFAPRPRIAPHAPNPQRKPRLHNIIIYNVQPQLSQLPTLSSVTQPKSKPNEDRSRRDVGRQISPDRWLQIT